MTRFRQSRLTQPADPAPARPARYRKTNALLIAAGTVLAGLAGAAMPLQAAAQTAETRGSTDRKEYAIPAGRLSDVLAQFAAAAGTALSFDPQMLAGRDSPGLRGRHSIREGFTLLLAGSGYELAEIGGGYSLRPVDGTSSTAHQLPSIEVTAPLYGARETNSLAGSTASVGVVTAEAIEDGNIRYVQDAYRRLGNVMDGAFVNSGFVIRGMNSEGFVPAGAPMGSLYIDGILQTRYSGRFGARNLWDTEQVEVYRGPQSTLSGRAATAGAVYIKTKDPVHYREAELAGTIGNDNLVGTAFMMNTPLLTNEIALRVTGAMERERTDVTYPSYENYANHNDFRTELSQNLRAKLLLTPDALPDTRALISYSYSNDRPNERLIGIGTDFGLEDDRGDWYAFPTYAEYRQIKVHNAGLEVTHDLSDALRLTSQTGLNYGITTRRSVDEGTPGLADGLAGEVKDTLVTQELRLNYDRDRWKWVAGLFGSYQHFDSLFDATLVPYLKLDSTFDRKTTNLAAFGEATYEFAPTWYVTLGGRLDYLRERTAQANADSYPYDSAPFVYENRADFNEVNFVPKIGLSKDIAQGHTVGVTYSEGFRTGGFYVNSNTGEAVYYDPEKAQNYELFYKGRFPSSRLTLNANLFFTKYTDQQIEIRPDPNDQGYRETTNAASSNVWGFEIEPTMQVTDRLSAFASIGYLNTEFETFDHASYGNLAGQPFPEAPEWTIGLGGHYEFGNGFYLGADAKYTADYIADFGVSPTDSVDAYTLVNAQAGYRQGNWEIMAFAQNLFDERYYTFVDHDAAPVYAQIGAGRTVGVTMKLRF